MKTRDDIVLVDLSHEPVFPEWVLRWKFPELQTTDCNSFDLRLLGKFPPHPTGGCCPTGFEMLEYLEKDCLFHRCLNLQDGKALVIHAGLEQKQFIGKWFLLWKSAAFDLFGNLFVPYVQNIGRQTPIIHWYWLEYRLELETHWGLLGETC